MKNLFQIMPDIVFPEPEHFPASFLKFSIYCSITSSIARYFDTPVFPIRCRHLEVTWMTVPKIRVNKNHYLLLAENYIWSAWKRGDMSCEVNFLMAQCFHHNSLWFRSFGANMLHVFVPLLFSQIVHLRLKNLDNRSRHQFWRSQYCYVRIVSNGPL